ncbi:hypothetical protein QJQ45_025730 [Haematococcus lacustris]|nr:hypothetical protein QJQ45_025730 [Haematococcus lacustris]
MSLDVPPAIACWSERGRLLHWCFLESLKLPQDHFAVITDRLDFAPNNLDAVFLRIHAAGVRLADFLQRQKFLVVPREEFEKERAEMVESVHRCSVQAAETHRLEWENRQRADEIRELQKALSDAHAFLFEERQRLLALQAENDELRLQELEDRKRIQQLLAGSDSKARQQASSYSVEALLLKIESLQAQLQEHKQLGNERVAALVEDRRIREAEEVAHRSHCNQQLEQLASKLGKVEEQLRLTTCDFIRARRDKQAADETIASLETALAQERQRAAEEFNSLRKASDSELRETRSTLEGKLEAITSNLRKQLKAKEEELINLSSMHTHAAASADERVAELEAKISRLTAANKQLEVRRFQDQEGWSADVTSLRKQLTAIDRRLHEMRLADRLDDEDRLEAIIHGLRRRAPEALPAPAQGHKGQKPRVASGKPGSKGGGGGGGDDVHAGKDVHGGKDDPSHGLSTWVITDPTAPPSRGISPRLQAHVAALAELKLFRAVPPASQSFFSVLAEPLWYSAQVRMNPAAGEAAAEQGWTHVRHVREALHSPQLEGEARWAADLVRACLPEPWQGMVDRLQPPQPEWECLRVGPGVGFVMRRTPLLQPSHWVGPNGRLYPLDPTGQGPLGAFWAEGGAAWEPAAVARVNKPSYRLTPEERATHLRPLPAQHHVAQEQAQGQELGGAPGVGRGGGRARGRGGGRGRGRGGGGGRRGAGGGAGGQAADPADEGPGTWPKEEWLLGPWAHLQLDPQVWGMGTTTLLDISVKHARVRLHQLQRVSADPLYPPGGGLWPALWGVRPPRAAGEPEVAAVADGALRELELKWEASVQQVAGQGAAGEREQQGREVEERLPEEVQGSQPPRWLDTSARAHQRPSPQMRAAQQAERQLEAHQRRGGRQPVAQPAPRADTADQLAVGVQAGQPCAKVWKELLDPTLRREHVIVAWRVLHASLMVGALWGHILKGTAAPGSSACRFCQPGHLETLTHAFLTCPAVVPAWEWVLDVYGRLTGTRPPSGDAMLLLSGRPTRGEAPPFQPPDSLLWLRLRVAYLGAVWRLRSSGAATALQPQQVARRVVEEVISTLTTAVKRDWHRVGRDIRVGLCGAVPSTWFKGKDPELDAAHFDQLWPEASGGCFAMAEPVQAGGGPGLR